MKIVLLGSVNPWDFEHDSAVLRGYLNFKFGRSIPVSDLAESLNRLGHEIIIIGCAPPHADSFEIFTKNGIRLIFVKSRKIQKLKALTFYDREVNLVLEKISQHNPDIIHAHWTYEYALAAHRSQLPYLVTVHDAPWEIFKDFRNFFFFMRYVIAIKVRVNSGKNLVYVSSFIRKIWQKQMMSQGGEVIPNMSRFSSKPSHIAKDGCQIISVGNANGAKNLKTLISAWELVAPLDSNLQLHLVGPGLEKEGKLAQSINLSVGSERLHWHGSIDRDSLSKLYHQCSILVHPSIHESFGLVFLEAFKFKLAVIALENCGGAIEVVGSAGILLERSDKNLIAEAILKLTNNEMERNRLIEAGSNKLNEYSETIITEKYLRAYERQILEYSCQPS